MSDTMRELMVMELAEPFSVVKKEAVNWSTVMAGTLRVLTVRVLMEPTSAEKELTVSSTMCPPTAVTELTLRELTNSSRTTRRSPTRVLTRRLLMEAMSSWALRASMELTSIVLAIWVVTLNTSPWKVLRRSEEIEASAMCPATTAIELTESELTNSWRTMRRSPSRLLTRRDDTDPVAYVMELAVRVLNSAEDPTIELTFIELTYASRIVSISELNELM